MRDFQRRRSLIDALKNLWRWIRRKPPGDPWADRMAPVRRGPKGRSGAAVAELEDHSFRFFRPRKQ